MKNRAVFISAALMALLCFDLAAADDDDHRRRRNRHREQSRYSQDCLAPVSNETYRKACGDCHFAYQPALLPAGSWQKILAQLENHFTEQVKPESKDITAIADYLQNNAAERSRAKLAVKIVRSLGGQTPLRVTDIPYIRHQHHDVPPAAFQRKSVGSFSNCLACHTTADKGVYNDHFVRIPN